MSVATKLAIVLQQYEQVQGENEALRKQNAELSNRIAQLEVEKRTLVSGRLFVDLCLFSPSSFLCCI